MVLEMNSVVVGLEQRGVLPVERAHGAKVECLSGRIWITEQDVSKDVVLEAGDSYEILRDGVVVVQALRAATVGLRASARPVEKPLAARLWRLLAVRPAAPARYDGFRIPQAAFADQRHGARLNSRSS